MCTPLLRRASKFLKTVICGLLFIQCTGCWDRQEVNDLAIILAAGIDKGKGNLLELSVQVYIPSPPSGGDQSGMGSTSKTGGKTLVRSAEGTTFADAVSKLQEKLPRRIFWGHDDTFIFSDEVAKGDIREHIDFIMRAPAPRERANVFISKGPAKDVLALIPPLERSSAEVLRELAKGQTGLKVSVKDLAEMMIGDAQAAALPLIHILPAEPGTNPKQTVAYIHGSAVIKKGRMIGMINDRTTRGLLWLRDEVKTATVTIKPEEGPGYVTLTLLRSWTQLVPRIDGDRWSMTVKLETEDDVVQNTTNINLVDPEVTERMENQLEAEIAKRVRTALVQPQTQLNADIFGFAEAFHRKYPKEWKKAKDRWDEIFPKVEVTIVARSKILRTGLASVNTVKPKEEVKKK